MKFLENKKFLALIIAFALISILTRLVPHINNFVPITAFALFIGAFTFSKNRVNVLAPIGIFILSDFLLFITQSNYPFLHDGSFAIQRLFDYSALACVVGLGYRFLSKQNNLINLTLTSLSSSLLFFVISNFGVWFLSYLAPHQPYSYPPNFAGLLSCYAMGLEFIRPAIIGDLFYTISFFGFYHLVISKQYQFFTIKK